MTPRRRRDELVERPGILATGVDQPLCPDRLHLCLLAERVLEDQAMIDEPIVMGHAALCIVGDLPLIGLWSTGGHEIRRHVLRRVVEATCPLDCGATSEIDDAARLRSRAARATSSLEHQDVAIRIGLASAKDRCRASRTEADHQYVGGQVRVTGLGSVDRQEGLLAHGHAFTCALAAAAPANRPNIVESPIESPEA